MFFRGEGDNVYVAKATNVIYIYITKFKKSKPRPRPPPPLPPLGLGEYFNFIPLTYVDCSLVTYTFFNTP